MISVTPLFEPQTSTFTYVVYDQNGDALIIDPVLDYDPTSSSITTASIERVLTFISENHLRPQLVLDTHIHADHMTGARTLADRIQVKTAIGKEFRQVQKHFAPLLGLEHETKMLEDAYDLLLSDAQELKAGSLSITSIMVPGHTPSCMAYLIGDALFSGDALFQPELGCGRTDFPGGSAAVLFRSIKERIYVLDPKTRLFVGHDYPKAPESPRAQSSVEASREKNILINDSTMKEAFIKEREARDQKLAMPRLFHASMQVNIVGGRIRG